MTATTIEELDRKRDVLQKKYEEQEADQRRIDEKRKQIALPALGDDNPKAQRELDRLTREKNQKALEKENTQFAITAAEQQKQELQQKEREAQREKDKAELLKLAKKRVTLGKDIDNKLGELANLFQQHQEVSRQMDPHMGGNSGRISKWQKNMILKHKQLAMYFEMPMPPGAGSRHFCGFAEMDRGVMSRKGASIHSNREPKMPRKLKGLKITEVSLCKRGINPEAKIVLFKSKQEETDMAPITKSQFSNAMQKAAEQRFPNDTPAQAFNKFLETPDGKSNYGAYLKMDDDNYAPKDVPLTKAPSHNSPANLTILAKAQVLMKSGQAVSKEQAVSQVLMENPDLYEEYLNQNPAQTLEG